MKIFCDLDGVLTDFDKGVRKIFRKEPSELPGFVLWPTLIKTPDFYTNLEWMADGKELWNLIKRTHPTILTGIPRGKWAEPQKREWCKRELGEDVPVITCQSHVKQSYCNPGDILIDDRETIGVKWQEAEGIFILHTSTQSTKEKLMELK